MFTDLHELAKRAPILITITAQGDDLVRVNVASTPVDTKSNATFPQPLSLLATPTEFDADFVTALATWQAPKRSLIQQAQDATGAKDPATPTAAASKETATREKAGRKTPARGAKAAADPEPAALQAAGEAAGEAAAAADQVMASSEQAGADDERIDTLTLDLF